MLSPENSYFWVYIQWKYYGVTNREGSSEELKTMDDTLGMTADSLIKQEGTAVLYRRPLHIYLLLYVCVCAHIYMCKYTVLQ